MTPSWVYGIGPNWNKPRKILIINCSKCINYNISGLWPFACAAAAKYHQLLAVKEIFHLKLSMCPFCLTEELDSVVPMDERKRQIKNRVYGLSIGNLYQKKLLHTCCKFHKLNSLRGHLFIDVHLVLKSIVIGVRKITISYSHRLWQAHTPTLLLLKDFI